MPIAPEAEAPPAAVEPDSSPAAPEAVPGGSSLALGQAGGDVDLEHGFFSRGLSDEAMQAVTDREGEREFLHQARPAGRRRLIAIASCGFLVVVALALGVRGFFTERDLRTPVEPAAPVTAAKASGKPSSQARQQPQSIDKMPLELVPPVAAVPRIVSVSELRAKVPEGPMPAAEAAKTESPAKADEPAKAEAPAQTATAKAPEPAKPDTTAKAEPPAKTDTTAKAEPPSANNGAASVTGPSPAQQRLVTACSDGLRAGRYREVEGKCKAAFAAAPAADLAAGVAQAALEHGRNSDAAAWAKKAIGVDPKLAQAFVLLGGAEQQLGHNAEARAAYSRYLELAPNGEHAQDVRALLPGLAQQ